MPTVLARIALATALALAAGTPAAAAGGPQVAVEFDAPLVKEMAKAR
jgi:hypothetical protein